MAEVRASYARAAAPVTLPHTGLAEIECSQCHEVSSWSFSKNPPPEILPRHFSNQGWLVKKKPVCPDCQLKNKEREIMPSNVSKLTPATAQKVPSDDARKARRYVYMALEDYYDDKAHAYKDGQTDAKVAAEAGTSESVVTEIRERDFGPLKPPSELEELREELSAAKALCASLEDRLEVLIKKNGWAR